MEKRVDPDEGTLTKTEIRTGIDSRNLPMHQLYYSRLTSNVAVHVPQLELTITGQSLEFLL